MIRSRFAAPLVAAAALLLASGDLARPAPAANSVVLAPHRAIYDLKLSKLRGKRAMESLTGRIVYDFTGSACDGYTLQFRQVTEMDSGEGRRVISDLRTTTWEEGEGRNFKFKSENFLDRKLVEAVDGQAERKDDAVSIDLKKPQEKQFSVGPVVFPTEQMRQIIVAAKERKSLLELPVYDGSENGEKTYHTLTIIGQPIPAGERVPTDAAAKYDDLKNSIRWPVTISYFDRSKHDGEQTPVYAISFELYENGISRALVLDYGDFVVAGEMTALEVKDVKACR